MTGKEHTIFKSYLFLTNEEEQAWKKDIAMWMNDCTEDDYEVTQRFYEDIWDIYDCEKANLNKTLPNNIVAFGTVGTWRGNFSGYKVLGNNLNEILSCCECDDLKIYTDRYDVQGEFAHHDGTHYMTFRMVKDGVDIDRFLEKVYNGDYSKEDITRYTKSLRPYVKEVYGF